MIYRSSNCFLLEIERSLRVAAALAAALLTTAVPFQRTELALYPVLREHAFSLFWSRFGYVIISLAANE